MHWQIPVVRLTYQSLTPLSPHWKLLGMFRIRSPVKRLSITQVLLHDTSAMHTNEQKQNRNILNKFDFLLQSNNLCFPMETCIARLVSQLIKVVQIAYWDLIDAYVIDLIWHRQLTIIIIGDEKKWSLITKHSICLYVITTMSDFTFDRLVFACFILKPLTIVF